MSEFSIEELLRTAAGDGGSVATGPRPPRVDFDELFQAWSIERGHSIECEILLRLSKLAIANLMANDRTQSTADRRSTKKLIRQIDDRLNNRPHDQA